MTVSICIPTFRRPAFLREAIDSCFEQDHRPTEIVIGDDSPQATLNEEDLRTLRGRGVAVKYSHHRPSLGQADNVNRLLQQSVGSRLMLLHDDDRLRPGGLDRLMAAWDESDNPVAVYGFQNLIDDDGNDLPTERTAAKNRDFSRTPDRFGRQSDPVGSALLRQIPNNGYLIDAAAAKAIRVRPRDVVGDACDIDFSIRLAQSNRERAFVLIPDFVSDLRISAQQISKTSNASLDLFTLLRRGQFDSRAEPAKRETLRQLAPNVVGQLARTGSPGKALRVFASEIYGRRRRWSTSGGYDLAKVAYYAARRSRLPHAIKRDDRESNATMDHPSTSGSVS